MKKLIFFCCLFFLSFTLIFTVNAQKENSNWLGGYIKIGNPHDSIYLIQFSDTGIVNHQQVKFHGNAATFGTSTSYSDPETGELLLFSNGMEIYDGNLQIIEDGENLYKAELDIEEFKDGKGHFWPLESFFIPQPGNKNIIYFLNKTTIGYYPYRNESYYHVIQRDSLGNYVLMNPESPVFLTNTKLHTSPIIIKHGNGRDWWILFMENNGMVEYYRVDPSGVYHSHEQFIDIEMSPDNLSVAVLNFATNSSTYYYSSMAVKASSSEYPVLLHRIDFDRCAGMFYNPETIPVYRDSLPLTHTDTFDPYLCLTPSPDGKYLFANTQYKIYQFDLSASNWYETRKLVHAVPTPGTSYAFFGMFYGQDGRLYVSHVNDRDISVINKPHRRGKDADFRHAVVRMPENMMFYSFTPTVVDFNMGPIDGDACDTLGLDNHVKALFRHDVIEMNNGKVDFMDLSKYHPTEWHWDFDDGNYSSEQYPIHKYNEAGTYNVCLTASNENGSDTYCENVTILKPSSVQNITKLDLRFYPNPVSSGRLFLENPQSISGGYSITNMNGVELMKGELYGTKRQDLHLKDLPPSTYIFNVITEKGDFSEKIIIQ